MIDDDNDDDDLLMIAASCQFCNSLSELMKKMMINVAFLPICDSCF